MTAGWVKSRFKVPAFFLRPGEYTISVGGYRDGMNDWVWGTDLLVFHVREEWGPEMDPINLGLVNIPGHGAREQLT